jgi:hypothetical protein
MLTMPHGSDPLPPQMGHGADGADGAHFPDDSYTRARACSPHTRNVPHLPHLPHLPPLAWERHLDQWQNRDGHNCVVPVTALIYKENPKMPCRRFARSWSAWSDGEIARKCAVSPDFVNRLRPRDTVIEGQYQPRTFIHPKSEAPTTMNTARIGERIRRSVFNIAVWTC